MAEAESHTPHKFTLFLGQQKGRFIKQKPSRFCYYSQGRQKWNETLFYSQAIFFSSCHILASTCCLIKPSVITSKTHYRALYVKGLLSLGPVCIPLHSHQSSPCLQVLPPEHKRILIPRRAILLILREVSGDVQNGNGKRKGKSKASCSSDSTDGHGPDQT